jgi:HK97 gp10 family phage protein
MADVKMKGLSELQTFLNQLPAKVEANILRGGLRAGAKPVRADVVANAPVKTGEYRDGIKISTSNRGGVVKARVRATGKHAFLGPWLEFGAAAHKIVAEKDKSLVFGGLFADAVNHPGVTPRPHFRPALDRQAAAALTTTGEYIKKRLTKQGLDGAADVNLEVDE